MLWSSLSNSTSIESSKSDRNGRGIRGAQEWLSPNYVFPFNMNARHLTLIGFSLLLFGYIIKVSEISPAMELRNYSAPVGIFVNNFELIIILGIVILNGSCLIGVTQAKQNRHSTDIITGSFFLFKIYILLRFVLESSDYYLDILKFFILFGAFYGVRRALLICRIRSLYDLSKIFLVVSLVYYSMNILELILNPSSIVHRGRLFGLSGHPNEFGIGCAVILLYAIYYINSQRKSVFYNSIAVFVAAISVLFVILSGSRTAFFCMASSSFFFVVFLGQVKARYMILISLVVFGLLTFLTTTTNEFLGFDRLTDLSNTRSVVFGDMIDNFKLNPFLGDPATAGGTSNSYLFTLSSSGLVGFSLLALHILILLHIFRPYKIRNIFGNLDVVFCLSLLIFHLSSALLSGYLLSYFTFPTITYIIMLASFEVTFLASKSSQDAIEDISYS